MFTHLFLTVVTFITFSLTASKSPVDLKIVTNANAGRVKTAVPDLGRLPARHSPWATAGSSSVKQIAAPLAVSKKNLTTPIVPPTACASLTVACSAAPTAPAAQQCCPNLVCDPHDSTCHTADGLSCLLQSSTCAYGSVCTTLGSAGNQATCQLCNSPAANNNSCVV
ncbi:MAG TPA: hypothetical protein VJJ83_04470, partial [Candidatus Babeliales bacterium]|nr:hypothetical protein [Candidatus Babeliales bacterium]